MSDELEAIRATFGEMTEVYNDPIWPNGHATIATLLRLLDAAREELAEERAKISAWTDDERRAMRAAILAYLSALPKDGTVEAVARALCVSMGIDPDAETMMTMADPNGGCRELGECSEWETMVDQARAVLRTLATRAQGESS